MTHPTILQIVPRLETGGAELSAIEISEAVVRAGGRALIATEGGRLEAQARAHGVEIVHMPVATKNPLRMMFNTGRLVALARDQNIALLHARSRAPAWSALWAARTLGRALVTTYHGAYSEASAVKRFYNGVMARGDIVIANSRFTAALIQRRYATPADRLRVIYRGVDGAFRRDAVAQSRIDAVRRDWQVAAGDRVVLQAARLSDWKGQRVVVAAAGELLQRGALGAAVIVLAGDAQGRSAYREQLLGDIARGGLDGRIRLVGHVSDMAAAFAAAELSIVASTEPEAFGRAAAESQALGCPVIATRLGAPPETVLAAPDVDADQTTGWLIEAGNVQELADCLQQALTMSQAQRSAMGRRGIAHVERHFTLEDMKRQTLDVYDELLGCRLRSRFSEAGGAAKRPGFS